MEDLGADGLLEAGVATEAEGATGAQGSSGEGEAATPTTPSSQIPANFRKQFRNRLVRLPFSSTLVFPSPHLDLYVLVAVPPNWSDSCIIIYPY